MTVLGAPSCEPLEALVPRPEKVERHPGELLLGEGTSIASSSDAVDVVRLWRRELWPATGLDLPLDVVDPVVRLVLDPSAGPTGEGYRLSIDPERALVVAAGPEGLVNALQTFRQLLPPAVYRRAPARGARWVLPAVEIEDAPRFPWRGALLDVSRHFFPPQDLFRFVDLLALHKLNALHLHLTDDQGWRFPSKRYPRLTEVGAWRQETRLGHEQDPKATFDGTPHGGFYTREELGELVAYAAERNVTVLPEIDLPGHVQAAIAAYPELGKDGQVEVRTRWGISEHVLNLSEPTVQFCRDILEEVLEVFPSAFVHVGGDECPRTEWKDSPAVQSRIAALGLADEDGLQHWFTGQMNEFLVSHGRRLVGWDEILEGGSPPEGAVVMSWRGTGGGIAAARAGLDVVICPETPCYLDHYQSAEPDEPLAIHGLNTLEQVYAFEPVRPELSADEVLRVLGTQFLVWTCYTPTWRDVEYAAFPRAAALAEVAWSRGARDYPEFEGRLRGHLARLDALSVNYRPLSGPRPWQKGGSGARKRFDPPR